MLRGDVIKAWSGAKAHSSLHSNCAFTPQAARASMWPEVIQFQ